MRPAITQDPPAALGWHPYGRGGRNADTEGNMRKRVLRGVVALAAIAALGWAATAAYGSFFAGTYAGKITGVQGISLPKGGNMKFKISGSGKVTTFQFSKIYVACADGNVHRTSGHVRRLAIPIVNRVFTIHASTSSATLKIKGLIRGSNHARGYLNLKGVVPVTSGGALNCKTGKQFWSARHVRGT
jgi:hypothetical protein